MTDLLPWKICSIADSSGQVGAGIQIPPNSSKLLSRWGVMDVMSDQAVRPDGISFRRWENGDRIGFTDLSESFVDLCGAPYYVAHRAHLHSALYERAVELGVTVRLGSRVVHYDPTMPSASLASGDTFKADLIVAADGESRYQHEVQCLMLTCGFKQESSRWPEVSSLPAKGMVPSILALQSTGQLWT